MTVLTHLLKWLLIVGGGCFAFSFILLFSGALRQDAS